MRKPDGQSAGEALRSRASLSALLTPDDLPAQPQSHFPGMRRKSVLPRHISRSVTLIQALEAEDEVDKSADVLAVGGAPTVLTPGDENEATNDLASRSDMRTPTPTPRDLPLPIGLSNFALPPIKGVPADESKQTAKRTSPRKGGGSLHPPPLARKEGTPSLGMGRPPTKTGKPPPPGSRMPSMKGSREVLADLLSHNEPARKV